MSDSPEEDFGSLADGSLRVSRSSYGRARTRLLSLQKARAIAALAVVVSHAGALARVYLHSHEAGAMGVEFFFVLSGFILYHVHSGDIGHPARFPAYLFKRFSRIYPIYWIVAAILIPVAALVPSVAAHSGKLNPWFLVSSLALLPMQAIPFLGVTWSLEYEIAFYALFGLLILNARLRFLLPLWGITLLLGMIGGRREDFPASFLLDIRSLNFLGGILAAIGIRRFQTPLAARIGLFVGGALLVPVIILRMPELMNPVAGELLFALGSAFLVYALATRELSGPGRKSPGILTFLGDASYSIYLIHYPVESAVARLMGFGLVPFFTMTGAGVISGACLHRFVEVPVATALRSHFSRGRLAPRSSNGLVDSAGRSSL